MYEVDFDNACVTGEFDKYKSYYEEIFRKGDIKEQEEKEISLGYRVKSVTYILQKMGRELPAYKQYLITPEGEEVHSWFLYDDHDFLTFVDIIVHSDGEKYFVYKECLYGYSVLRLRDDACMHYVPRGFVTPGEYTVAIGESFIMTDFYYSKDNDMLAANGCFWACPSDVVVIDFKEPLKAPKTMLSFHQLIDPEYANDEWDDVEFKAWHDSDLVVKVGSERELTYSAERLREIIDNFVN